MKKVAIVLLAIVSILSSCVDGKTERMRFTEKSPVFSLDGGQKEIICKNYSQLVLDALICGQDRVAGDYYSLENNGLSVTVSGNVFHLTCEPSETAKKWTLHVSDRQNAFGVIKISQK